MIGRLFFIVFLFWKKRTIISLVLLGHCWINIMKHLLESKTIRHCWRVSGTQHSAKIWHNMHLLVLVEFIESCQYNFLQEIRKHKKPRGRQDARLMSCNQYKLAPAKDKSNAQGKKISIMTIRKIPGAT